MKRGHEKKTDLTPDEKIRIAMGYEVYGIEQHALAALFAVNPGRVADAIAEIRSVTRKSMPKEIQQ